MLSFKKLRNHFLILTATILKFLCIFFGVLTYMVIFPWLLICLLVCAVIVFAYNMADIVQKESAQELLLLEDEKLNY
jgi:hypothetical protein